MTDTKTTERKIKRKAKPEADKDLHQALKESFPASDPPTGNQTEKKPVRPVDRKPAKIDKALVDKLAHEVEEKQRQLNDDQDQVGKAKSGGRSAA